MANAKVWLVDDDDGIRFSLAKILQLHDFEVSTAANVSDARRLSRFESARQLMGYCGVVPSEDSSGKRTRRGGITKTGNAHLRRIIVEAAWSYRRPCRAGTGTPYQADALIQL